LISYVYYTGSGRGTATETNIKNIKNKKGGSAKKMSTNSNRLAL